jgi:hypothetical protein
MVGIVFGVKAAYIVNVPLLIVRSQIYIYILESSGRPTGGLDSDLDPSRRSRAHETLDAHWAHGPLSSMELMGPTGPMGPIGSLRSSESVLSQNGYGYLWGVCGAPLASLGSALDSLL